MLRSILISSLIMLPILDSCSYSSKLYVAPERSCRDRDGRDRSCRDRAPHTSYCDDEEDRSDYSLDFCLPVRVRRNN